MTDREKFDEAIDLYRTATKFIADNPADFKGLTQTEALKKISEGLTEKKKTPFSPKQFIDDLLNYPTKHEYKPQAKETLPKRIRDAKEFVEQNGEMFEGLMLIDAINRATYLEAVGRIKFKK